MEISQRDLFIDKVRFTFKKDQITLSLCHLHIKYTGMRVTIKVRLVLKVCRWLSSVKKEGERMGGGVAARILLSREEHPQRNRE